MRRSFLSATAPACLLLGLTPVAASAGTAPSGNATGTAAQVSSLAGISSTGASAGSDKAESRAAVVSLNGQPALGTGGSQPNEGQSGGALVDTGTSAPAQVQVAPWQASSKGTAGSAKRSSSAAASAAKAEAPGLAKADVLGSEANADHTTAQSRGSSTSEALDLTLGTDTARLVLLHSEVGSSGKGHSYLVGLNGTEIGTDDQLGKSCAVDASVASLVCLTASGDITNGITSGNAEVLGVKTALGLDSLAAFSTAADSGTGTAVPSILPAVAEAVLPAADTARAVTPAITTSDTALARTGVAAASLAASALAAILSGLVLRLIGRRRTTA